MFSVDTDSGELENLDRREFKSLGILERQDLEEWAIENPRLLGEDLLVVTSEFENFADTYDRLDILALDRDGKLVVVELKRDRADKTTDLQAIKYASYCATLTAVDVQKEYREFWNDRRSDDLQPEAVGQEFAEFLNDGAGEEFVDTGDDGWAEFELDDKPRILLAAGEFGVEVTSPVVWLIEEYGMDITCARIEAYEHGDRVLLHTQQVIPMAEAEDYMTKRREKQEQQDSSGRRKWALPVLLDRGVLVPGDEVVFDPTQVPDDVDREWSEDDDFWRARVTGKTGQSNNLQWLHDGNEYSFTGAAKEVLYQLAGRDKDKALNGYRYWCHPAFDDRTILDLRNSKVTAPERKDSTSD